MPVQTVQTFLTLLRATHARGASLDVLLPSALHNALGYIENNYNLKYMRFDTTIIMNSGSTEFTWQGDIANNLKVLRSLWSFDTAGVRQELKQITPEAWTANTGDIPVGFMLRPESQIDGTVKQIMTFDTSFKEAQTTLNAWGYMNRGWNGNEASTNVYLLNKHEQLVLARCMMQLAPVMRDQTILTMWGSLFQDNLQMLLQREDEFERGADGGE
jgi:hypothetical protein